MAQKEDAKAVLVSVPSVDPKKPNEKKDSKKQKKEEEELSEESQKIKNEIELLVERIRDPDDGVAQLALQTLSLQLRGATTTMTSVPLPLKFLRPYFADIEKHYEALPEGNLNRTAFADVLSILGTVVPNTQRKSLHYRLTGSQHEAITSWGQEYVRNISGEISAEYEERQNQLLDRMNQLGSDAQAKPQLEVSDLLGLVFQIVPFYMSHHNEIDAIDLLSEVQQIEKIATYVDSNNYQRVTQYLLALGDYAASDEELINIRHVVYDIFMKTEEYCQAVRVALKMNDKERLTGAIAACQSPVIKKQIGYLLGACQVNLQELKIDLEEEPDLMPASNEWLTSTYKMLGKELDVLEPKSPEDVYKTHLEDSKRGSGYFLDSAKMNLAATFVNAFVNAGFCTDTLMTVPDASWIFKNRDMAILSAAASMGVLMLWNVEDGIQDIDKLRWSNDPLVKAGSLLAFGLVCSSTRLAADYAFGLLADQVEAETGIERDATILGLGVSHTGWQRDELLAILVPLIIDTGVPNETSALAALSLALSFIGSASEPAAEAILQTLIERQMMAGNLDEPLSYLFGVALGLLFLGRKEACEATVEALQAINEHVIGDYVSVTVMGFAYAGSGDVTKVQHFLKICVEQQHQVDEKEESESVQPSNTDNPKTGSETTSTAGNQASVGPAVLQTKPPSDTKASSTSTSSSLFGINQAAAVISMSLVALGESYGSEMQLRMIDHLLQYGNLYIRRAVPLVFALLSTSNPKPQVIESLSKLTHDSDADVALNAILALGFVGAGTNNAKIGDLLRQLASSYYSRSVNGLFCVRLSQGLLYMGKGLLTISPLISDGFLIAPVGLACLLVVLHSCLFLKQTFLGRFHYLLYVLLPAMRPRMLITVDEELNPLSVAVRVGQAVDTAGQAGKPRTITGFQTHTVPVLLNVGERAELATNDYVPVASTPLEGVVILKKSTDGSKAEE